MLAANLALKYGWAINVGGGFHHASRMFLLWLLAIILDIFRLRWRRILFLCGYHYGDMRFV